jgi:CTP:phosphocholine cytidylyltransferase-like protein
MSSIKSFEIIFCCSRVSNKIFDHTKKYKNINFRIIENQLFQDSNCCESIRIATNNTFNEKFLILSEDILLSKNILDGTHGSSKIFIHDQNPDNNFEISAICDKENLENLTIGIKQNYWAESLFLNEEKTAKDFRSILNEEDSKNKLFFEIVNSLNKKHQLKTTKIKQCYKLNNSKTLKRIDFE